MWEYKQIEIHWSNENSIELLNEAGKEGWELCSVLINVNGSYRTAYFKRFITLVKK